MEVDTTNMCSHLKRKLFEEDGPYYKIWLALQADNELSAIVRSRQLHIYRNGKKILILAGKAAPKVLMEDRLATLIGFPTKQGISLDDVIPQNVVCSQELRAFFAWENNWFSFILKSRAGLPDTHGAEYQTKTYGRREWVTCMLHITAGLLQITAQLELMQIADYQGYVKLQLAR